MWPARVRRFNEAVWHGAVVMDVSFTGALLELACRCTPGEWLVVEIEFPTGTESYGAFARCGPVIRTRRPPSTVVAVQFATPRTLRALQNAS
jgi:hypothetical protein